MRSKSLLDRAAWALLCALVFSLPLEKSVQFPGLGDISRVIGLAAFATGAAAVAWRRRLRPPNAALLLAAAFVLWSGLTWRWSASPPATAARFVTLAQLLGMVWLIWELCRTATAQTRLLQAYLAGAAVSSVWTIARAAENRQTYWRRYATAGFDPNDLAITLALALTVAFYLSARSRGLAAALVRLAAVLAIVAILLTASRTALIAGVLNVLFVILAWRPSTLTQRLVSVGLVLLLILGSLRFAPAAARERLATLPAEVAGGTFHDRTRIWKAGIRLLRHHPVRGVGAGAYAEAAVPWLGRPPLPGHRYAAHNTSLSVLVETGAVGFLIWGMLLATLAWFSWLLSSSERALWFTFLAVWAVGVFTLTWEHRKPTWLMFALIMTAWARAFQEREP